MSARRCARRFERACCSCVTAIPLAFVYGLTSWGVWVIYQVGQVSVRSRWLGTTSTVLGAILYILLNWSYTTAVFTPPGSTTNDSGYGLLPTVQDAPQPTGTHFTVKSNGETRFCKKCQARKPDRAHHCSTCRRCVLKMDHHCPWLATCIGLKNHKAFLLFLIYTTVFCFYGFAVSGCWIWAEIIDSTDGASGAANLDGLLPVNFVMMCVIGGLIGLVVGAFTAWHIMLASKGQTTIECLEKTRYLSPLRRSIREVHNPANRIPQAAREIVDFHASALPGITRPEEGEERRSAGPIRQGPVPMMSYEERERQQSRRRYEEYLDEQDSEKLPNVFDLGWKRNLAHLFGPQPLLWFVPVCNTTGDGWSWEASPRWVEARDHIRKEREAQRAREISAGWGSAADEDYSGGSPPVVTTFNASHPHQPPAARGDPRRPPSKADRVLGRDPNLYADGMQDVPLARLNQHGKARTIGDELDELDLEEGGASAPAALSSPALSDPGSDAERKALDVVTNGGGWGRGGASGMLRKGSDRSITKSSHGGGASFKDEGVD